MLRVRHAGADETVRRHERECAKVTGERSLPSVHIPGDPSVWFGSADHTTRSGGVSVGLGRHHVERLRIDRQGPCYEQAGTVENMSMVGHEEVDDRQLQDGDIHGVGAHGPQDPVDRSFSLSNSPSIGRDDGA